MRIALTPLVIGLAAWSVQPSISNAGQASDGEVITVRLSSFAFDPDHVRLKASVPVRLRLVNDSGGGHNFSAPSFFAAGSFLPNSPAPLDGRIEVAPHQTVEVALVPRVPGTYPLECTHFLHHLFGMHGTIEVIP